METKYLCIHLQLLTHFWLHKLVKLATTQFCTVLFLIKLSTMKHFVFSERPCPCRQTFKKIPPAREQKCKQNFCFVLRDLHEYFIFHTSKLTRKISLIFYPDKITRKQARGDIDNFNILLQSSPFCAHRAHFEWFI